MYSGHLSCRLVRPAQILHVIQNGKKKEGENIGNISYVYTS